MIRVILKYALVVTLVFQCVIHFAIPLMPHPLNDSAWYYMYANYLFGGSWIHEDLYPSFKEPVMYYSSLGYPLLLYIAKIFSFAFSVSFSFVLLQLQFAIYLLSSRLLWLICSSMFGRSLSAMVVLLYLWFLPLFNYAHLVMSESWFIFCVLVTIYYFQCYLKSHERRSLAFSFLLAGYTFLVRPVGAVMLPMMLCILFFQASFKNKRLIITTTALLFFLSPVVQSAFNKIFFSTWTIREGVSWNLWNRVITEQRLDPNTFDATAQLRVKLKDTAFLASDQHWWDISSQLSQRGWQPKEIQDYCRAVCVEGLKKHPGKYVVTTLQRGFWELPLEEQETFHTYARPEEYITCLQGYIFKQHAPLMKELNSQSIGGNAFTRLLLNLYKIWHDVFRVLEMKPGYVLLYLVLIAVSGLLIRDRFVLKQSNPVMTLIVLFVFTTSVIACAFEVFHSRYFLPSIVLEFIAVGYLLQRILSRRNFTK
jgi:hypothetical protein